jgi:hypothetical protein
MGIPIQLLNASVRSFHPNREFSLFDSHDVLWLTAVVDIRRGRQFCVPIQLFRVANNFYRATGGSNFISFCARSDVGAGNAELRH